MRIGFDVSPLVVPHSHGLSRLVEGVVSTLESRGRLEVVRLAPAAGQGLRGWRQRELPRIERRLDLAGIHSFVSAFPLRGRGLRVHTVHELPWKHAEKENADWKHRLWARLGVRRADASLCPSALVARDLGGPSEKIRVCPWGVGAPFADEPPPGEIDEVVPGRYRLGEIPYALCLGAVRAKKNLAALLHGLAELRRRDGPELRIVVGGEDTPQLRRDLGLVSRLGLSRWISTPGWIEERDLPALLRLASVVPMLSRSEGFGFPVLEALASGTPVLVTADSAQAELAGRTGIAVDPDDATAVADGLERALREREELRDPLVERAREFTWERCVERIENLWLELLGDDAGADAR